jgi:hypothetical protein
MKKNLRPFLFYPRKDAMSEKTISRYCPFNTKITFSRVWQVGVSRCVGNNGAASLKTLTVWMGGLFNPEAFVTATRQCVAQVSYSSSVFMVDLLINAVR